MSWLASLGAKLYLLHVQDESTLRTAIKEGLLANDSSDEDLQALVKQLIDSRFSDALSTLNHLNVSVEYLSLQGDPKPLITDSASEIKADLVVIGMRGITAASRIVSAVIGSVTEYVMRKSPCPTLVVRLDHKG